jgi:hypothetical protein
MPSRKLKIAFLFGLTLICIGFCLPYTFVLTLIKFNDSSVVFEFAPEYYETTIRGYESYFAQLNLAIVALIALIFFFTKRKWFKFLLIPFGLIFLISQLMVFLSTIAGFGAPFGNTLRIGFYLMFIGTISVIVVTAVKPDLMSSKDFEDF